MWAGIIVAIVLGGLGISLAGMWTLPPPATITQTRILYGLLGVLISLLTFGKIASWIVHTVTRLAKQLALKLASEIINQFTKVSSRGWSILPAPASTPDKELQWEGNPDEGYLRLVHPVILDTSSIIDGRVLDVAKTGFLSGLLLIPDFILTELQQVADSADQLKRFRGRKGFEIVNELKKVRGLKIEVWDKEVVGKTVDEKLLKLAKVLKGKILTCDYNLGRVAQISGLQVLNLNDVANALKARYIPGEKVEVKIVQEGKDKNQGVGYLADGTMIIVNDGSNQIGSLVQVEVAKVLQVPAGRMVFGKIAR